MQVRKGVPADQLVASGSCAEVAARAGGQIAVRNSRHSSSRPLVHTRAEMAASLAGVKNGESDACT
jgi:Domain of unknown function (DUF397)